MLTQKARGVANPPRNRTSAKPPRPRLAPSSSHRLLLRSLSRGSRCSSAKGSSACRWPQRSSAEQSCECSSSIAGFGTEKLLAHRYRAQLSLLEDHELEKHQLIAVA